MTRAAITATNKDPTTAAVVFTPVEVFSLGLDGSFWMPRPDVTITQ